MILPFSTFINFKCLCNPSLVSVVVRPILGGCNRGDRRKGGASNLIFLFVVSLQPDLDFVLAVIRRVDDLVFTRIVIDKLERKVFESILYRSIFRRALLDDGDPLFLEEDLLLLCIFINISLQCNEIINLPQILLRILGKVYLIMDINCSFCTRRKLLFFCISK